MNHIRFRRKALSLAVMAICSVHAHAATYYWTGAADSDFSTTGNWQEGILPDDDANLIFFAGTVGAGSTAIQNVLPTTPMYNLLAFVDGDFNLSGTQIALRPFSYSESYYGSPIYPRVLINDGGNTTISAPLQINSNAVNRVTSTQEINNAEISVIGGSLTLSGAVSASLVNLQTNVASGATLNLNTVDAKSFRAYGGNQNLNGILSTDGVVGLNGTQFRVEGEKGSIQAGTGVYISGGSLTLDNATHANNDRLSGNVSMSAGTSLVLTGHATDAVTQSAGDLSISGWTSQLTHVKVEGAGADTELSFSNLSWSGLVNFASNGVLGLAERIKSAVAPVLTDGLMANALVNEHEFATYDATQGIKSATTTNSFAGAAAADNVYITAAENLVGNTTVNSLAVNNAAITSAGTNTLSLASGKLLTTGTSSIAPAIDFGAKNGQIINFGNAVLAGGVTGSNGLNIVGNGSVEFQHAGQISGNFTHTGQVVLSADDALQGASVSSYSGMDIGSTTQHFQSFDGHNVTGSGNIVSTSGITLTQSVIDASLQGQTISLGVYGGSMTVNGDINASQSVNFGRPSTVNGVISGAANVSGIATLTNQNIYTGTTSGNFTLIGNGSIANSSGVSGTLTIRSQDGDNGALDRVGDSANVHLLSNTALSVMGQGNDIVVSEDIGVLNVYGTSQLVMSNSANGSTTLRADALNVASNATLELDLGNASEFYLDSGAGLDLYTDTNIFSNVSVIKNINGGQLSSWVAYDALSGRVAEAQLAEKSLNTAGVNEFVRVSDAVNENLNNNRTVGAVNFDTTQTVSGAGILTVGTGQMMFWQNNTLAMAGLDFGSRQGVINNAGSNTISSVISGSNGLRKMGTGTLELTGQNTYTGVTRVDKGKLDVNGGRVLGGVDVNGGASLELRNGAVATIANNYGTVDLRQSYTNAAGSVISGGGTINAHNGLANQGEIEGQVNNAGTGNISNSGFINRMNMSGDSTLTNTGTIWGLSYSSSAVFTNTGTVRWISNSGNVINGATGIVGELDNFGTFTNNGNLSLNNAYISGDVINTGTATLDQWHETEGSGTYIQTGGTTIINGYMYNDIQLDGGCLQGSGRLYGNLIANSGCINPGNSPGMFSVEGNVFLGAGATLNLEVDTGTNGQLVYDQLIVSGSFNKQGTINISLGSGVNFDNGIFSLDDQSFGLSDMFSYGLLSSLLGQNLSIGGVDVAVTADFLPEMPTSVSAVPVPASIWLLGSGLLGLAGMAKRRSSR